MSSPWPRFASKLTTSCSCVLRLVDMCCAPEPPWKCAGVFASAVGKVFFLILFATQHFLKGKLLTNGCLCASSRILIQKEPTGQSFSGLCSPTVSESARYSLPDGLELISLASTQHHFVFFTLPYAVCCLFC